MVTQSEMVQQYIDQKIQSVINKEIEKIINQIKVKAPMVMVEVKREIFAQYKLITGIVIEQVFYQTYGDVFDLKSLQNSLIYYPNNGLKPQISYNPNIFRFNDKFFNSKNKFNENSRNWERKNRKYLNPSFYTDSGSMSDYFDNLYDPIEAEEMESEGYGEDDYMDELIMDYDSKVFNSKRNKSYKVDLNDTYKKAISRANFEFDLEWNRVIKIKLSKKYGLQLT